MNNHPLDSFSKVKRPVFPNQAATSVRDERSTEEGHDPTYKMAPPVVLSGARRRRFPGIPYHNGADDDSEPPPGENNGSLAVRQLSIVPIITGCIPRSHSRAASSPCSSEVRYCAVNS